MREEAVKEFVASAAEADAQNVSHEIAENFKRNEAAIKEDAVAAFSALCDKAALSQSDNGLGDIETIRFSFLRTGLAEEKAFYRIDADDERWLVR